MIANVFPSTLGVHWESSVEVGLLAVYSCWRVHSHTSVLVWAEGLRAT